MPKRTINTRVKAVKAATIDATPDATPVKRIALDASDPVATPDATPVADATPTPVAADATPDATDTTPVAEFTTTPDAVITLAGTTPDTTLTPHPVPTPDAVAKPATPDAKAEFLERKSAATLSAIPLYNGPSLSVHRSDKQPAAAAYLERVASPVQKAKSATVRDDSALLTYYDHLTTYHAGNYLDGFNPDRFGADLGALSRNASLYRVQLTDCGQHVQLTPLGLTQARNLVAKRNKA